LEKHIHTLLRGIELEEQEERKRYHLDGGASLKLLKNSGLAIHPIRITRKTFGYLDYPEISFSTPFPIDAGGFLDGCAIEVFCSGEESVKGMLLYFDGKKGEFRVFAPDFPDWIEDDGVGIKVAPDVRTTQRMKDAVEAISESKRLSHLFGLIHSGSEKSATNSRTFPSLAWENTYLNESQQHAISEIVFGTDAIRIVHGPPGTGKTTTMVEAVYQLCKENKRILISAPSNAAVDHFAQQLHRKHPKIEILRIGNNTKVTEAILPFTPEGKLKNSKEEKEVKRLKIQAEELRRMAHQYKRHFGKEERDQRNLIIKEVKQLRKQIRDIQAYNEQHLFEKAQVILGTPMAISDEFKDTDTTFDKLIIDEAGQCLEPLAWSIFPFSEQIILAGDHFQLPPTLLSHEAIQLGFNKSILEVCIESLPEFSLLNVQYRMKQPIAEFSNRYFYEGKIQTWDSLQSVDQHLFFYDTAGADCEEESGEGGTSLVNKGEATAIIKLIRSNTLSLDKTVLISPYSGQVSYLRELLPEYKVSTIDSYQGQEAENVIISLVRCNNDGTIGFLKDYRRMNVAMTRAQEKLFVIGDSATLGSDPFYGQFLDYVESIQAYHSVWELEE
jgi:DNA polymerase III delta prime subunit